MTIKDGDVVRGAGSGGGRGEVRAVRQSMIEDGRAYQKAHSEHMMKRPPGHPRGDWLGKGPKKPVWTNDQKAVFCTFDAGHPKINDLWVTDAGGNLLGHVDLTQSNADSQLLKFGVTSAVRT